MAKSPQALYDNFFAIGGPIVGINAQKDPALSGQIGLPANAQKAADRSAFFNELAKDMPTPKKLVPHEIANAPGATPRYQDFNKAPSNALPGAGLIAKPKAGIHDYSKTAQQQPANRSLNMMAQRMSPGGPA